MAAPDGRNSAVDQIVWAEQVVPRVLVGPLTTQRQLGMCYYMVNRLLGPQCPLVKALEDLIFNIDDNFFYFSGKMETSHR